MFTQLNIFILLFGALQGLLFWLFLFHKKTYKSGYIFLLIYLGVMLLQLTLKVMNKLWLMENVSLLYSLSHYLPLLYGPLCYLFVKDVIERRQIEPKALLHFLPFILIVLITYLLKSGVDLAFGNLLYNAHIRLVILFVSLFMYHLLALRKWYQQRLSLKGFYPDNSRFQMSWVKSFVLMSFIVCALVVAALFLLYINYPFGHQYRYGFTALTIFMYWITYTALKQPAVFSVIRGKPEVSNDHISKLVIHRPLKKYASSTLEAIEKKRICDALETLIKQDKPYLDAGLTINLLAKKIPCSKHSLSQVLNECMQQSFYDYINYYRVNEAKTLLLEDSMKNYKIASVAYDSGFNSLSTFNDVFKKIAGTTPSQFKKQTAVDEQKQRV